MMFRLMFSAGFTLLLMTVDVLGSTVEEDLADYILSNQDSRVPPSFTKAFIELAIPKHIELDRTNEILTLDTRIDLTWKDDRLAWAGVNDFEDIHQINLPASSIWYPDITLYNSANGYTHFNDDVRPLIGKDGSVFHCIPIQLRSYCHMAESCDHNNVTCSLVFGPWMLDLTKLDLHVRKDGWSSAVVDGTYGRTYGRKWKYVDLSYTRNVKKWDEYPEDFVDITFNITLEPFLN